MNGLWLHSASTISPKVDALMAFLLGLTLFFSIGIAAVVLFFAFRYRNTNKDVDRVQGGGSHLVMEITWTVIPLILVMLIFFWSSGLFYRMKSPPSNAMEVFVTGKQWMWKTQHLSGAQDINALHVPVNTPIKLTMISEDVIHSFFVPAFRVKQDVLPGRYTTAWFQATRVGQYHLFCSQYCGTSHSQMTGTVYVMTPADFAVWLAGGSTGGSMESSGEKLFGRFGCVTCHKPTGDGRAPSLVGLYNTPVKLRDGRTVVADNAYLRESILIPSSKVVAGYENMMPLYQSQLSEQNILELLAYIKSLKKAP
jgi:cytochrome c oxidase subunit II